MTALRAHSVEEVPVVELQHWSFVTAWIGKSKRLYVVGQNAQSKNGRVSTPIKRINLVQRTLLTSSGRFYKLSGPSGTCLAVEALYVEWLVQFSVINALDVTGRYFLGECGSGR